MVLLRKVRRQRLIGGSASLEVGFETLETLAIPSVCALCSRHEVQDLNPQLPLKVPCLLLTAMLPSGAVSQNKLFQTLPRPWFFITAMEEEQMQAVTVAVWFAKVFSLAADCLLYSVGSFAQWSF